VVLKHSVEQDWDEDVVSNRRFTPVETGFEIVTYQVPCLVEDVTVQRPNCGGMLYRQSGNGCVIVQEHHLRPPGEDRWKWRMQHQIDGCDQRLRPALDWPKRRRAPRMSADQVRHLAVPGDQPFIFGATADDLRVESRDFPAAASVHHRKIIPGLDYKLDTGDCPERSHPVGKSASIRLSFLIRSIDRLRTKTRRHPPLS
jgi:hypothetical protein